MHSLQQAITRETQVRNLKPEDVSRIQKIYKKFYAKEFEFPDFFDKFLTAFVIEHHEEIIIAGGVRTLAEAILITDKSKDIKIRRESLIEALQISGFIADRSGYDQIHAFVQDEKWIHHLMKYGFKRTTGKSLVLG